MKKGQLQKIFFEYLKNNQKMEANENQGGLIYSEEYFNINLKNNTIYIQGFGLITRSEPFNKEFVKPDWIGFYQEDLSTTGFEDNKFILGYDSPFSEENKKVFPGSKGPIGFVPYSYFLKMKNKVN